MTAPASVVVPVWGPPELTDRCLRALCEHSPEVEIIAVDNTGHYVLPDECQRVILLHQPTNIGCAPAKALGAAAATAPIVITLDCDAYPHAGWLDPLLAVFDDPSVGMAGPRILSEDGSIQTACIRTWHGSGSAGGENRSDEHASNSDEDGATGACMAIRRVALDQCPFDAETFRSTYDDVDLSLQFREAGWRVAYVSESTVTHRLGSTGPERWDNVQGIVANMNIKWGNR